MTIFPEKGFPIHATNYRFFYSPCQTFSNPCWFCLNSVNLLRDIVVMLLIFVVDIIFDHLPFNRSSIHATNCKWFQFSLLKALDSMLVLFSFCIIAEEDGSKVVSICSWCYIWSCPPWSICIHLKPHMFLIFLVKGHWNPCWFILIL